MRHALILPWTVVLAACGPGDTVSDDVSDTGLGVADDVAPDLLPHLEALYDAAMDHGGHRAVGSQGYDASVAYVTGVLEDLGLTPWTEDVDVLDWSIRDGSVTWTDGAVDGEDLGAMQWSPGGSATGAPVAVDVILPAPPDANTSTSGCEASDFDAFPTGAVAVIQRGTCTYGEKVANAEAAGAVAVLVFNEGQPGRANAVTGVLDETDLPTIPVLGLAYGAVEDVLDAVTVTVTVDATTTSETSVNVLVDLPGDAPERWVVGAHLDSVPEGPGINDNGTGVATLLHLAEVHAARGPRPVGIRLAFWAAEEVGLVGSLAHVDRLSDDDLDLTLGYLNYDMVGSPNPARFVYDGDGSELGAPESLPIPAANTTIEAAYRDHFGALDLAVEPTPYDGRSDYLGFALVGVPTGGLFTGAETFFPDAFEDAHPGAPGAPFDACYHRSCDAIDNLDLGVLDEMARAAAGALDTLTAATPAATARRRLGRARPEVMPRRSPLGGCHDHGATPQVAR